ncbi:MAG: flagellar export chaperone FliS [Phycisphaerales bacterium]
MPTEAPRQTSATNVRQANTYLRTQVLTASPERLRLLLLEGALRFLRQGRDGLERRDYAASYDGFSQARNIVVELMTSIREDQAPELCARVRSLYTFIFQIIAEASLEKDAVKAEKAIELMEYERATWELAMQKIAVESCGGSTVPACRGDADGSPRRRTTLSVQG